MNDYIQDFVVINDLIPNVILDIRYYSKYNFVGERIDGYEQPLAILTRKAAIALKNVNDKANSLGYRIKIYDCYRPQSAVEHFVRWSKNNDTSMKDYFYPNLEKDKLFKMGYIASKSSHSRGSTIDLTLFDIQENKDIDMGGTFDYFGEISGSKYTKTLTEKQINNRKLLKDLMISNGFKPYDEEWWHFTLENEPYPNTYFSFPINSNTIKKGKEKIMAEIQEDQLKNVSGGSASDREKTIRVSIDLPNGSFDGDVVIEPYIDGELQSNLIRTVNASFQSVFYIDVKGIKGNKLLTIKINDLAFMTYELNFDNSTYRVI